MIGLDPLPWTYRELLWMSDGKSKEAWNHTADLLSLLANINRNTEVRSVPFGREHFHPYLQLPEPGLDIDDCDISVLKVFLDEH